MMMMSNLPFLTGGGFMLAGLLWLLWPTVKRTSGVSMHVQIEAMIAQASSEKTKQLLREAGKSLYDEPQ